MRRVLAFIPIVIVAALAGFFIWGLNPERDPNNIPSVLIDKPAPSTELAAVEGVGSPGITATQLTEPDGVLLVNFFASWCVPCKAEHAVLTRIAAEKPITLYGINYKDKPADAARWLTDLGNPYAAIGSDFSGRTGIDWGISGVPETFIIAADGTVVHRIRGPIVNQTALDELDAALAKAGL